MTARQPRRARRRSAPGSTLPRPAVDAETVPERRGRAARAAAGHREHHVATDYSYVRRDLMAVAVFSGIVTAFVLVVAFF